MTSIALVGEAEEVEREEEEERDALRRSSRMVDEPKAALCTCCTERGTAPRRCDALVSRSTRLEYIVVLRIFKPG
jgi:hypothetical protein